MALANIVISIQGNEHEGKTSLIPVIVNALEEKGITVKVARTDPQLEDKFDNIEKCVERLTGDNAPSILIQEINTGHKRD
jgi:molybdopterin-guanine dinucleotide biosynthesis protein